MDKKKEFFVLIKKNIKRVVLLSFLDVVVSLLVVGFAFVSQLFIDNLNTDYFSLLLVILCVIIGLEIGLKTLTSYLANRFTFKLEKEIKKETFNSLLSKDYLDIKKIGEGEILTRLTSDTRLIASNVINLIPQSCLLISRLVFSFVFLFYYSYIFALLFMLGGVIVFLGTTFLRKKNKELHLATQQNEAQLLSYYNESLISLLVLKVFSHKEKYLTKEEEVNENLYNSKMKQTDFNLFLNSFLLFLVRVSYLCAVIYGAIELQKGNMTIGVLLALVQLVSQIAGPFTSLSNLLPSYYSCLGSLERIDNITLLPKEKEKREIEEFENISFHHVSFAYDEKKVLEDVNLTFKKGVFYVIKGESGSGKSTLIQLILGVFKPQEGEVLINDKIPSYQVKDLYSFVPQTNFILSGTILENLLYFTSDSNEGQIKKALNDACLTETIEKLPNKLNTKLSDLGDGLSSGQLQRLSLARGLLASTPLLILDEATSSLDQEAESEILTNLKTLNKTIIFVSHKDEVIKQADVIIEVKDTLVKEI